MGPIVSRDVGARSESARSVPEQYRHRIRAIVCDGEILLSITIQVPDCDRNRQTPGGKVCVWKECDGIGLGSQTSGPALDGQAGHD
jgi:hypothetical protein